MHNDRTNDFSPEQIKFCKMLDGLTPQIEALSREIRSDRKMMKHDDLLIQSFSKLEDISNSFSEICGGSWKSIKYYPSFDLFIESSLSYLERTIYPGIQKLKKKVVLGNESGMSSSFCSYLDNVESIHNLLILRLEGAKNMGNKKKVLSWLKKHWKWFIGVIIIPFIFKVVDIFFSS